MIEIQLIDGPDEKVKGTYKFFQNQVYLGRRGSTMHIQDPALAESHLMIEVVEGDLIVHPQAGVEFYLIDGKRAASIRKIRPGQVLTIGRTQLAILSFEQTNFATKKSILDAKLAQLIEQNDLKLNAIEVLAKAMK